jgi:hypothetical protein
MDSAGYTLILSKGTHLVSDDAAEGILEAIRSGEPLIRVDLDLFGRSAVRRETTIVTSHVVALTKNLPRESARQCSSPGNDATITPIQRRERRA